MCLLLVHSVDDVRSRKWVVKIDLNYQKEINFKIIKLQAQCLIKLKDNKWIS